jgi:hypothetical protein
MFKICQSLSIFIPRLTIKFFIVALSLIAFSGVAQASPPEMLVCDNCSDNQMRNLVYSQSTPEPLSEFYVIDFKNKILKRFYLHNDPEFMWRGVTNAVPNSEIESVVQDYFYHKEVFESGAADNAIRNAFFSVLELGGYNSQTDSNGMVLSKPYEVQSSSDIDTCGSTPEIVNFIKDSRMRTQAYEKAHQDSPIMQNLATAYNRYIGLTGVRMSNGVKDAALPLWPTTIPFTDGGSIQLISNPYTKTMDVAPGGAFDCNGHELPTDKDNLAGEFNFASLSEFNSFRDLTEFLGAEVLPDTTRCILTFRTTCSQKADGEYVCRFIVPDCLR